MGNNSFELEFCKSLSQSIEEMIIGMRKNNFAFKKLRFTFTACSSQPQSILASFTFTFDLIIESELCIV